MFTKYFRTYPWGLQLVLLMMLVLTMTSFVTVVQIFLLPKIFNAPLTAIAGVSESSPKELIHAAMWSQLMSHAFTFLVPSILFAYWTHPQPKKYLGWKPPGRKVHWLLVPLITICAIPVILFLEGFIREHVHFSERFTEMQEMNDRLVRTFLNIENLPEFILSFVVMAIIPALGEELLFRSLLMRMAAKTKLGPAFAILITAALFTLMHPNPIGYAPIFLAGALLGLIYYLTGSIWMAILAHLINNGVQVILMALANQNEQLRNFIEHSDVPLPLIIIGVLGTALFLGLLVKYKTVLSRKWYQDFEPEELS